MATLQDYRDERLKKLATLKEQGFDPYPAKTRRTHSAKFVIDNYDDLEGATVTVVGRLVSIRSFGKLAFLKLRDMSGDVQLYLQKDVVAEGDPATGILGIAATSFRQLARWSRRRQAKSRSVCVSYAY